MRLRSLVALAMFFPVSALAASADTAPCNPSPAASVALASDLSQTVPDVPIGVYAKITNDGSAYLSDGVLFVRVVDSSVSPPLVIDEFAAESGIDLAAGAATTTTFTWRVPLGAIAGTYQFQGFYVYPGAPFIPSDAAEGASGAHAVTVTSAAAAQPVIDADAATVQGRTYSPGTPFILDATSSVPITLTLANPTAMPFKGSLTWSVYGQGHSGLSDPVATRTDVIKMQPESTTTVSYTIATTTADSYYVEASLSNDQTRSRLGMFLSRNPACAETAGPAAPSSEETLVGAALVGIVILLGAAWELWKRKSSAR